MKRIQERIVDSWKAKGLDLTDTSKMHRMAEDALTSVNKELNNGHVDISWWMVVLIVAISTIISWVLLFLAVNPQFN